MPSYEEYKLDQARTGLYEARLRMAAMHSNDAGQRQYWLDELKRLEADVALWSERVAALAADTPPDGA